MRKSNKFKTDPAEIADEAMNSVCFSVQSNDEAVTIETLCSKLNKRDESMFQLRALHTLKEQKQRLLDPPSPNLVGDKPSEARTAHVVPDLDKLQLALSPIAVMTVIVIVLVVIAVVAVEENRAHRIRNTLRIVPSTKENPFHVSTKQSLTLLCDGSRCPLPVTGAGTAPAGRGTWVSRGCLRSATGPRPRRSNSNGNFEGR